MQRSLGLSKWNKGISIQKALTLLAVLLVVQVLLSIAGVVLIGYLADEDAATINVAGRQRMLSQKSAKEFFAYSITSDKTVAAALRGTLRLFDTSLEALIQGGEAPATLNPKQSERVPISPPSPTVLRQLLAVKKTWQAYRADMEAAMAGTGDVATLKRNLWQGNMHLLTEMNKAVQHIASESDEKARGMRRGLSLITTINTFLIALGLLFLIWRKRSFNHQMHLFSKLLQRLGEGDWSTRFGRNFLAELNLVGERLDVMSAQLQRAMRRQSLQAESVTAVIQEMEPLSELLSADSRGTVVLAKEVLQENDALDTESQALKVSIDAVKEITNGVHGITSELSNDVASIAAAAEQASVNVSTMASAAEEMASNIDNVNGNLEQVSASVAQVSSAVTQMNSSLGSIRKRCQLANERAAQAKSSAHGTLELMDNLSVSAGEIGNVVELINNIAEQTNMLALNASIEAAGAGDAGAGFAVVANEVKDLARQTADATKLIEEKTREIKNKTREASDATHDTTTIIEQMSEANRDITNAVDTQAHSLDKVSRSMSEVALAAEEVTRNASELALASQEVSRSASEAAAGTEEIARSSANVASGAARVAEEATAAREKVGKLQISSEQIFVTSVNVQKRMIRSLELLGFLDGSIHHTSLLSGVMGEISAAMQDGGGCFSQGTPSFDVQAVKNAHLQWLGKLEHVVRGRAKLKPEQVASGHECAFGQWYDTEGKARFRHLPLFQELGSVHMEVHETARAVVGLVTAGKPEEGLAHMDVFNQLRAQLFKLLDQLYMLDDKAIEGDAQLLS